MPLSVTLLTTQADCDQVLADLDEARKNLDFRRLQLERNRDNATERATTLDADIASTEAEVNSLNAVIASLPDGNTKTEMQNRLRRADFRLFSLQQRKSQFGTTAVVLFESQLNETNLRIGSLDTDIGEVQGRKSALPA
jgi:chromosome segregation ATPase